MNLMLDVLRILFGTAFPRRSQLRAEKTGYNYWTITNERGATVRVIRDHHDWLVQLPTGQIAPMTGGEARRLSAAIRAAS